MPGCGAHESRCADCHACHAPVPRRPARRGGCWRCLALAPPASCSPWARSSGAQQCVLGSESILRQVGWFLCSSPHRAAHGHAGKVCRRWLCCPSALLGLAVLFTGRSTACLPQPLASHLIGGPAENGGSAQSPEPPSLRLLPRPFNLAPQCNTPRRSNGEVFRPQLGTEAALSGSDGSSGSSSLSARLQRTLLDIQYGRVEHPWGVVVE